MGVKAGPWLMVVALLAMGCVQTGATSSGSALVHSEFPYAVSYDDEQQKSVLGEQWSLETYRRTESGADKKVVLERKDGFDATYELDFDDDDKTDLEVKLPFPDLTFVSKKTNARLEVTTLLLDKNFAQKELRVLLGNLVENFAGARSLWAGSKKARARVEKRFAARLVDSSPATLGGAQGLVATVESANLDQLQLDPKARWGRSRIFLLHAPFDYYAADRMLGDERSAKYHKYRVLLLVEYHNDPEDFEAQYPELLRLLNKIHWLTDEMLISYLAEQLAPCSKGTKASVVVEILPNGEPSFKDAGGLELSCSASIIGAYRFAATGAERTIEHEFDFSKPLKPAWLARPGDYREERAAPSQSASPAAPAEGVPPPAPAEGVPPPAPAEGVPPPAAPNSDSPPAESQAPTPTPDG